MCSSELSICSLIVASESAFIKDNFHLVFVTRLMIANRSLSNFGLKISKTLGHVTREFLTKEEIRWFEGIAYYI